MDHKWLAALIALCAAAFFFTTRGNDQAQAQPAPAAQQQTWVVITAEDSYSDNDKADDYHIDNTILLNTQTGETWILSVNDNDEYEWSPLLKKQLNVN